jgi:hypothetical protein
MLIAVKFLHTVVWALLAGFILALPLLAIRRRFGWALIVSAMILIECGVLAWNGGRCPLTDVAARFTDDRAANFDIYLPLWLAGYNKTIFGTIFLMNEIIVLACWLAKRKAERIRRAIPAKS